MKWVLTLLLLVTAAALLPAEPVNTKPPQHNPAATSNKKSASGKAVPVSSKKSARSSHTRSRRTRRAAPAYQQHPDPSRYLEIQKALADRGYFKGEVNGQWNDDSIDALKRFQADQKLDPDGKINSLSLIGLGLGPKHDGSLVPPVTPPPSASTPTGSTPVSPPPSPSTPESTPPPSTPPN